MDSSAHLTVDQLINLQDGSLDAAAQAAVAEHLASCAECRARADFSEPSTKVGFVSSVYDGRAPSSVDAGAAQGADRFERGSAVGRYLVIDVLGAGGMGVVYRAFDPELDRKVAIKLLQARPALGELSGGQAWLQREAQAMARLSHPNVLAVHDVGTLPGDRVFLAMELVDGTTLRVWLKEKKRSWREVVPVLLAAGEGLAAAHRAGLVHRDFKPDNVLVGKDGRVKVMDFGLARLARTGDGALRDDDTDDEASAQKSARDGSAPPKRGDAGLLGQLSPLTADLTAAGTVLGTPAYMAPELWDRPADAKSDQFAFGVALYESLFHARPFDKDAIARRVTSKAPLVPRPPQSEVAVPKRLTRIAMRALADQASDRFASMDELLTELAADPEAVRRRVAVVAAVAVLVVGAIAGTVGITSSRNRLCNGVDARLAGVWDAQKKRAVEDAFRSTGRPYADTAFAGVARALDAYSGDWVAMTTESCRATRVTGEQSDDVLALRQSCLDDRLAELTALVALFSKADASLVEKADKAAYALEPLKRCANVAALQAPAQPPADAASLPKLDDMHHKLAEAKAAHDAGQFDVAIAAADAAARSAGELTFAPGEAEALLVRGQALHAAGKAAEAAKSLGDAAFAALRGKRDDVAAEAAFAAAGNAGDSLGKDELARVWLGIGDAALARIGGDRLLELRGLEAAGVVAGARGELVVAGELHERALAKARELFGRDDHPALWRNEQLLAATWAKGGAYEKARPHYQTALALKEKISGPDHPDVALILSSLGACDDHLGDVDQARASLARALVIREKNFGKDSPKLVATLNNIADLERKQGKLDDALAQAQRGYTIAGKVPGPTHPLTHTIATTLAEVWRAQGKRTQARALFDDVIAAEEKASSPVLATTLASRAELALDDRSFAEAAAFDERAIAALEKSGGKDAPDLWRPLLGLGLAKQAQGRAQEAHALFDRALAIGTKAQVSDVELKPARDALAKP